jgi:hypothetical protein
VVVQVVVAVDDKVLLAVSVVLHQHLTVFLVLAVYQAVLVVIALASDWLVAVAVVALEYNQLVQMELRVVEQLAAMVALAVTVVVAVLVAHKAVLVQAVLLIP